MSDFFGNPTPLPADHSIFWMRQGATPTTWDVIDRRTGAVVDDELTFAAAQAAVVTRNQGVAP